MTRTLLALSPVFSSLERYAENISTNIKGFNNCIADTLLVKSPEAQSFTFDVECLWEIKAAYQLFCILNSVNAACPEISLQFDSKN